MVRNGKVKFAYEPNGPSLLFDIDPCAECLATSKPAFAPLVNTLLAQESSEISDVG